LQAQYQPQTEGARVHLLVEAIKQAFIVRDATVTDPSRLALNWQRVLTPARIAELAAAVDPHKASPWPRVAKPGDTVWMGALDKDGCMVSFIQSVYWEFGSGLVHPEYGFHWNNRGLSFSLQRDHVNALAPGLKPFHTLNPALAIFSDGRRLSYGTMGGEGQPQTQAAVFARYHYEGLDLKTAISKGRWLLGRTWGDSNTDLKLEHDLADTAGAELTRLGHQFRTVPACNEMMGHAGAIALASDGSVDAASDPRSDGSAPTGYAA
jgi:gamma-glutamyltranspeptidase/glutathione hydrolase